jgi:hypothetical protein
MNAEMKRLGRVCLRSSASYYTKNEQFGKPLY